MTLCYTIGAHRLTFEIDEAASGDRARWAVQMAAEGFALRMGIAGTFEPVDAATSGAPCPTCEGRR